MTTPESPWAGMPLCEHKIQFDCDRCNIKEIPMIDLISLAAQEVYEILGIQSEFIYEAAMEIEIWERSNYSANIRRQVPCPIYYKGYMVGSGNIDLLINDTIILELKSVTKLTGKDTAQLKKYLSGMHLNHGLLINFNPLREDVEIIEQTTGTKD